MKRGLSILAALLLASAAHGQNLAAISAGLMGSIPSGPTEFPTNNLGIRFCAQTLAVTNSLASWPSCYGGPVATNMSTAGIVTNTTDGLLAVRRSGASTWYMAFTPGIPMSTNMTVGLICTPISGGSAVSFGRTAATAVPYLGFKYGPDSNWNLAGKYFGASNITSRVCFIGHIRGTNLTINVNGWVPAGQTQAYSAGTIDQIGRIGSGVYHVGEGFEWVIWTNALSTAEETQFRQYSYETYGTPAP